MVETYKGFGKRERRSQKVLLLQIAIIALFLLAPIVSAADLTPALGDLPQNVEKLDEVRENLQNNQTREQYLRQEWVNLLEKNEAGRFILAIGNVLDLLSPLFILFLGIPYSFSWLFFLSLIVGAWIFQLIYKPLKEATNIGKLFSTIISLAVLGLTARFGALQKGINLISALFINKWTISLFIVVGFILMIIYTRIMRKMGKKFAEDKKKALEERREDKNKVIDRIKEVKIKSGTI